MPSATSNEYAISILITDKTLLNKTKESLEFFFG